jgi:hypothetical protein
LPEKPTDEWVEQFQNVEFQNYIFRLGNLTLLESGKNKLADIKSFADKQAIYQGSRYKLSHELADFDGWNAENISHRRTDMANKAAAVWKVGYQ